MFMLVSIIRPVATVASAYAGYKLGKTVIRKYREAQENKRILQKLIDEAKRNDNQG